MFSLGAAACYRLVLLTCALLMTSSHSEGLDSVFMNDVSGMSPVTAAAISGNKDLVEWLLGNGAVISGTTQDGSKPIHHAVQCNSVEVAKFLLDSGAALDETRSDGDTLLHIAAKRGSMEMATDLLARGKSALVCVRSLTSL